MSPRKRPRQEIEKKSRIAGKIYIPKKDNMENFQVIMVLIFFFSSFVVLKHFFELDVSLFELLKFYCLFLGISFLIPLSLYRKKFTISIYEYLIFNFISFSPLLLGCIFFLNTIFKSAEYSETYRIMDTEVSELNILYTLEGNAYKGRKFLRSISDKDEVEIKGKKNLTIYFSDGLFGIRVVERKELN